MSKFIFLDTIVSQSQLVDLYKTILDNEHSNHTIVVSILLLITITLIGLTWWWNKAGAKRVIKATINKEFEKELETFKSKIEETIDEKISAHLLLIKKESKKIELDLYRTLGYVLHKEKKYEYSCYWFSQGLDISIEYKQERIIRIFTNIILSELKDNTEKKIHEKEIVETIIKKLPDSLYKERDEMIKLLSEFTELD